MWFRVDRYSTVSYTHLDVYKRQLQNRKREIVLEDCEGRIGRITRIASLTGHEVECEKELDAYEAAVLFAAAEYMYHDDDIEMV